MFLQVRHEAMAALEEAKESGECGNPLEARLTIYADEPTRELLESFDDLRGLMIVSTVELRVLSEAPGKMEEGFVITAEKNSGEKCERCWMRLETVGDDPQHEGLCDRCARRVKKLQESQR
ncbi:MAG: zinc finger domain-containing protein [Armatimonadota bacterium]